VKILPLILILSLLTLQIVTASTPDFTISNLLNSTMQMNKNNHGKVIVVKQPYISSERTITNYEQFTLKKYDKFTWQNNDTIEIWLNQNTKTTLVKGSSYYFSDTGLYTYQSIYNRTRMSQINVMPEPSLMVNISYVLSRYDNNIPYEITKGTFPSTIVDTEKIFDLIFDVPSSMQPRDYSLMMKIASSNKTITINKTMTLKQNQNWTIVKDELTKNLTLKSGDIKNLGKLTLKNDGNMDFVLRIYMSGNATQFIYTPENITLIRGVNTPVPFMMQVPIEQKDGKYNASVRIVGSDVTKDIKLSFKVLDSVKPEMTNISISKIELYEDVKLKIYTKDNMGVTNCSITYYLPENETTNTLKQSVTLKMKKDNWLFSTDMNVKQPGIHWFNICITDTSGNVVCQWYNQTFPRLKLIQNITSNNMPTTKAGLISSKPIFDIYKTSQDKIKVKMIRFYTDLVNDTSVYDIRLKDDQNNLYTFNGVNSSVEITAKGKYWIEVKGEKVVKYDGLLTFETPKYADRVTDVHFNGQFRDYTPPHDYVLKWYGKDIQCIANDTGIYDTSTSRCVIDFGADVDETTAILPTTVNEMKLERQKWDTAIQGKDKQIRIRNYWISGMAAFCVIVLLTLGYYIAIYPNQRIMKR
jgi:hypothetical protein